MYRPGDAYTAIVPLVVVPNRHATDVVRRWFSPQGLIVLTPLSIRASRRRLDALVTRAAGRGGQSVTASGPTGIEREFRRRMELGELFAVCYADLDHFKDTTTYSYYDGDRVISLVSLICTTWYATVG